ncbi:MAG: ComEC/Rec2 family competence protein [bacterium]|nr:ComEC/Rec2 family competence protein [bacterium]
MTKKTRYTDIFYITLFYTAGILFQIMFPLSLILILCLCVLLTALSVFLGLKLRIMKFFFLIPFCLGLLNTVLAQKNYFHPPLSCFYDKPDIITGKVMQDPVMAKNNIKLLFRVTAVGKIKTSGTIRLFLPLRVQAEKNDILKFQGVVQIAQGAANFGEIDYGLYYRRFNLDGYSVVKRMDQIHFIRHPRLHTLPLLASWVKKDIMRYIKESYYPVAGNFLQALLLGIRADLPLPVQNIFIRTGTIHILSISGLHIGIIMIICLTFLLSAGVRRQSAYFLTLLMVLFYNCIVGYQEPIARSTIMFAVLILSAWLDRDQNYLNALALAGLIILIINPTAVRSISFQLSFLATLSMILFTDPIRDLVKTRHPALRYIWASLSVSFSSQVLVLPVLLYHFQQFQYILFLANILAVPLTTLIMSLTAFSYLLYHIFPFLSMLFSQTSNFFIILMFHLLKFLSRVPPLTLDNAGFPLLVIYLLLILLLFHKLLFRIKIPVKKAYRYGLIVLLVVWGSLLIFQKQFTLSGKEELEIIFFNLKGRSIFIKTPHRKYILIDSGTAQDSERHIIPFLRKNGISRLHYFFLTNFSRKRSEGFFPLQDKVGIDHFMDNGYITPYLRQERCLDLITQKRIPYNIIRCREHLVIDGVHFYLFNPPARYLQGFAGPEADMFNNSLVIKMKYKNLDILFCSDILKQSVRFLSTVHGSGLASDIINLPDFNHENYYISSLMECCKSRLAVVNKVFGPWEKQDKKFYRHVMNTYKIKPYFTEETGAVRITVQDKIKIETSRN